VSSIDSAAARAEFLARMLQRLCVDIGPRPAGTPADERCSTVVREELARFADRVELLPFAFTRWELAGEPLLTVGGQRLACYPYYASPPTPEGGLAGRLRPIPDRPGHFVLLAESSERSLATLAAGPFGPAVPRYDEALLSNGNPVVGIGRAEAEMLAGAAGRPEKVFLRFGARFFPGATSRSVLGHIDGERPEEIVIVAHLDTQYNTPGANDNAASLVTMLLIAESLRCRRRRYSLSLLASGAEEIGCLGACDYVRRRTEQGSIGQVRLCLNLDSLTWGRHPQLSTRHTRFARLASACYASRDAASRPRVVQEEDSLDGAPFAACGIPVLYVNSRGDDDDALRLWHRPEDGPARVDPGRVELSYGALLDFLQQVHV
jgi:Peptidase family M28